MQASIRQYNHASDYEKVGDFLIRTYRTEGGHINWLQPRWEYMHYHPYIKKLDLNLIGVWEANGEIVGVVHPEHGLGTAYFEIDPNFADLKTEMLKYAEEHLNALNEGVRQLRVYINDNDDDFQAVASEIGYVKSDRCEPMSQIVLPGSNPTVSLPDGFRLISLAEENDLRKIDRVMWRGFNHGDEPPEGGIKDRKFMQSAPNFREDLNIVVEAPDGNFVSYCGMWFEPVNKIAYVEPVATDPDYRRMGLASIAVVEGVRRCGELGATAAYVGSDMPVYLSMGFSQIYNRSEWRREWG
ncbi:GNAT family N-acetyltransferase [bacterium]|nr:GNAT family N-acetyltransferase [bacterium]